jgi:arylsulfatase A-like enzyme
LSEETLLVITSDHGEEIFEHGRALHQQPYEETSRVPLVFRGPGVLPGQRIREIVELVDVAPTILSILDLPIPNHVQGEDLTPALLAGESLREGQAHVDGIFGAIAPYLNHQPSQLVREIDGVRWSYVNKVYSQQRGERAVFGVQHGGALYRLDRDPEQLNDVALGHPDLSRELEQALLQWYANNDALSRQLGQSAVQEESLGARERARLRALGYAE